MKIFKQSVILLHMMNAFNRFFTIYQSWSTKAPYLTNCSMGFMIAGVGDVLCQRYYEYPAQKAKQLKQLQQPNPPFVQTNSPKVTRKQEELTGIPPFEWNHKRTFQMSIIRSIVVTPFVLSWYPCLTFLSPGSSLLRVMSRVVIDQSIGSPIVVLLVFIAKAILNNELSTLWLQIQQRFYVTWVTGLQYWPLVHMLTFGVIRPAYQPLFSHFASVYWNAVLSYYSNMKLDDNNNNTNNNKIDQEVASNDDQKKLL